MMHQTCGFTYLQDDSVQAVELPYAGKELAMVIFLPAKADGLADFEKTMTAAKLTNWLGKLRPVENPAGLRLTLPRFRVTAEFRLD